MTDLPPPVLEYLTGLMVTDRHPAWLQIGHDGRLADSGGPTGNYGLPELEPGKAVSDELSRFDGLLPAGPEPLVVPRVATGTGWTADIHIFRGDATDWVVLLDAREAEAERQLIQQKANELALVHEREARLIEDLDAFAHTVAHDLKNPLAAVVGYADLLLAADAVTEPEARRQLQQVLNSGNRMTRIIDELLLLAGVRKSDPPIVAVDMARVVAEVLDRLDFTFKEAGTEVVVPDKWPAALGHAPWVEETWTNYLTNAVKYGGKPPRAELGGAALPDGTAEFWVQDNGPGISKEDQARLFTPHTRLDQVRAKGHGLGLSIVRRIVRKLGGDVFVQSAPGHGSRFGFTLRAAGQ